MALDKNLNLKHVDIKTAFLHGRVQEKNMHKRQPEDYVVPGEEQKL